MSIALVQAAMRSFLSNATPEVLCIEGRWGTGKTYAWNKAIRDVVDGKQIAITKYAYVSLFGLKDSSDIIQAIYANTVDLNQKINDRQITTGFGNLSIGEMRKKVKSFIPFAAEHAKDVPYIAGLGGVARAFLASLVTKTIVCVDDFERKSSSISVNEIMGTITQLRDIRQCKVVLILNENSLTDCDKAELQRFAEKVFNRSFKFLPTAVEAGEVVFAEAGEYDGLLRGSCEELGIVNIRVMEKIRQFARELVPYLGEANPTVVRDILRSLVVIVWSIMSPEGEGSPSLSYLIEKREKQSFGIESIQTTAEEDRLGTLLTTYGFTNCDDFDKTMIAAIQRGYFDGEELQPGIKNYIDNFAAQQAREEQTAAWEPFHSSFDDNSEEVARSIFDGYIRNAHYLSSMNLDSAVRVLKDLGHPAEAAELLKQFIEVNKGKNIFNLRDDVFGSEVRDADVRAAFALRSAEEVSLPTALEAAKRIYKGGWGSRDEEVLANLSVADFAALFKSIRGDDRRALIMGCLEPRKISNATPRQKSIASNAESALVAIGRESVLNAHRLKAFQVNIPPVSDSESDGAVS